MSWLDSTDDLWILSGLLLAGAVWITMASVAVFHALTMFYLTIGAEAMILGIGLVVETIIISGLRERRQ